MLSLYRRRKPWVIAAGVIVSIYAVALVILYRTGNLGLFQDARLIEVKICLSDTEYNPVVNVPLNTSTIYLCGKVEGTTNLGLAKTVFYGDRVIDSGPLNLHPGTFFLPLFPRRLIFPQVAVLPGQYRVELGSERLLRGEVEFEVVE